MQLAGVTAATVLAPAGGGAAASPPGPRPRADGDRRVRRAAVGGTRGGPAARHRAPLAAARAAARRDRDRHAVGAPPLPAGAPEPGHGRSGRARTGAAPLARRASRSRTAAPRSSRTGCPGTSRTGRRIRTARSSWRFATAVQAPRSQTPSSPRPATSARSSPTAPAARATRCCLTPTGTAAGRRSTASARWSSPAAATTRRRGRSASFPPTACRRARDGARPRRRPRPHRLPPRPAVLPARGRLRLTRRRRCTARPSGRSEGLSQ